MLVIGCDFHPGWQQVCWVDTITGETEEKKLVHGSGEAERFYRQLSGPALIGMESTGNHQWFTSKVPAFKKAKTGAPEIPSQCPTTCVKMGHAATPHTRMMLMEARFRERVESRS